MTRIEEIRKRLEEATPGPWQIDPQSSRWVVDAERGGVAKLYPAKHEAFANAQLIAHTPSDIAFLLEEVKKHDDNAREVVDMAEASTARRCAEIAKENCQEDECGGFIAAAIRKEFNL